MKHFLNTLGLNTSATWNEILEAYRDQIRTWHPDRFTADPSLRESAEERAKQIHYALRRLKELRCDIGSDFNPDRPLLEQYLRSTNGEGEHGNRTHEDLSNGYIQQSFANWKTIATSLTIKKRARSHFPRAPKDAIVVKGKPSERVWSQIVTLTLVIAIVASGGFATFAWESTPPPNRPKPEKVERFIARPIEPEAMHIPVIKTASIQINDLPEVLTYAMSCNISELDKLVTSDKSLIDTQDESGQTALIWAAKRNCTAAIELLTSNGANPNLISKTGFDAKRWAHWNRNSEAIRLLKHAAASYQPKNEVVPQLVPRAKKSSAKQR